MHDHKHFQLQNRDGQAPTPPTALPQLKKDI